MIEYLEETHMWSGRSDASLSMIQLNEKARGESGPVMSQQRNQVIWVL